MPYGPSKAHRSLSESRGYGQDENTPSPPHEEKQKHTCGCSKAIGIPGHFGTLARGLESTSLAKEVP